MLVMFVLWLKKLGSSATCALVAVCAFVAARPHPLAGAMETWLTLSQLQFMFNSTEEAFIYFANHPLRTTADGTQEALWIPSSDASSSSPSLPSDEASSDDGDDTGKGEGKGKGKGDLGEGKGKANVKGDGKGKS